MKKFLFAATLICSFAVMFFVNQTSKNDFTKLQLENIQALSTPEFVSVRHDCFAEWEPVPTGYIGYVIDFTACSPCGSMQSGLSCRTPLFCVTMELRDI